MKLLQIIKDEAKDQQADYLFDCPGCKMSHFVKLSGTHKWDWNGSLETPTLRPSILVTYPEKNKINICHSFITDGNIEFLGDCTHELAGKIVELPNID